MPSAAFYFPSRFPPIKSFLSPSRGHSCNWQASALRTRREGRFHLQPPNGERARSASSSAYASISMGLKNVHSPASLPSFAPQLCSPALLPSFAPQLCPPSFARPLCSPALLTRFAHPLYSPALLSRFTLPLYSPALLSRFTLPLCPPVLLPSFARSHEFAPKTPKIPKLPRIISLFSSITEK